MNRQDSRHLLRRLAFTATPQRERRLTGLDRAAAFAVLWDMNTVAPPPSWPAFLAKTWVNTALAHTGQAPADLARERGVQLQRYERDIQQLRHSWIAQLAGSDAALRENLVVFFHGLFGSSSTAVEIPQALAARNQLYWRLSMGNVPALLEELVLDPAMMMQIGMDGHGPDRVSDRPAKVILDYWTVGSGAYVDSDVEELSRALTGWSLGASANEGSVSMTLNTDAPRAATRTGLVPHFNPENFDRDAKTLLGQTDRYDARSAVRHLALQPATARRISKALLRHLGVHDPLHALQDRLATVYLASGGSLRELLGALVAAEEFWSEESRWALIKSPVHLAAGACRQLQLREPPLHEIDGWLRACGQPLFDTAANGEGGWPDQQAWISPPDRLAIRYQLAEILGGQPVQFGLAARDEALPKSRQRPALPATHSTQEWLERLDPAPGIDTRVLRKLAPTPQTGAWAIVSTLMTSPQYQLA